MGRGVELRTNGMEAKSGGNKFLFKDDIPPVENSTFSGLERCTRGSRWKINL